MNKDLLLKVSMNGRMAYAIMCVEKYLLVKYPDKYWSKPDNNRKQQRLSILTDLGIYRPGETLHYTF